MSSPIFAQFLLEARSSSLTCVSVLARVDEVLASAGDGEFAPPQTSQNNMFLAAASDTSIVLAPDGFVMLWVPKPMSSDAATLAAANATSSAFGDSSALEDGQKEFWKVKAALR